MVQPLSAMPGEPGGAELAVAISSLGLQTWLSPLHIWHLLSGACAGVPAMRDTRHTWWRQMLSVRCGSAALWGSATTFGAGPPVAPSACSGKGGAGYV